MGNRSLNTVPSHLGSTYGSDSDRYVLDSKNLFYKLFRIIHPNIFVTALLENSLIKGTEHVGGNHRIGKQMTIM